MAKRTAAGFVLSGLLCFVFDVAIWFFPKCSHWLSPTLFPSHRSDFWLILTVPFLLVAALGVALVVVGVVGLAIPSKPRPGGTTEAQQYSGLHESDPALDVTKQRKKRSHVLLLGLAAILAPLVLSYLIGTLVEGQPNQNLAAGLVWPIFSFWILGAGLIFYGVFGSSVRARDYGKCASCGYDLRGLSEPRCPECGKEFASVLLDDKRKPS